MGGGVRSGGDETSCGQGEGRRGFNLFVPISHYLCSRGPSRFLLPFTWAGAGHLPIGGGGCGPQSIARVERGRGENRQIILVGPELFRFPRMWEGLGIQLGVAEHFLELGVVERALDRGVGIFVR